jgi:hypothetical protein
VSALPSRAPRRAGEATSCRVRLVPSAVGLTLRPSLETSSPVESPLTKASSSCWLSPREPPVLGPRCDLPLTALPVGSPLTNSLSSCRLSPREPPAEPQRHAMSSPPRPLPCLGSRCDLLLRPLPGWIASNQPLIVVSAQPSRAARRTAEATSYRVRLVPSPVGPSPRPSLEGSASWIAPDQVSSPCRLSPRKPPAASERSRHVESASAPLQFRCDLR